MEYNWDKNKLKQLEKEYLNLNNYKKCLSEKNLGNIEYNLLQLEEMLDILEGNSISLSFNDYIDYVDETHFLPKDTLIDFQNIPKFIQNWILNSMSVLELFNESNENITSPKFPMTNQELVSLSHDFFQWLPNKNYVQRIDKYLNRKENLLCIQNKTTFDSYIGTIFVFHFPFYKPFFLIERENTINDFCTLNHELAHGIYMASDSYFSRHNNHKYLLELEGYTFDFLSRLFLKEKNIVSSKVLEILEYHEFVNFLDNVISFYIQFISLSLYRKRKVIQLKDITTPFGLLIDEDSLSLDLQENPTELVTYALSYLTHLDLEKIAAFDLELAFSKFERIRYNKTNNLAHNLCSNGITFMNDHYQHLQEKIRKLNLIKK